MERVMDHGAIEGTVGAASDGSGSNGMSDTWLKETNRMSVGWCNRLIWER